MVVLFFLFYLLFHTLFEFGDVQVQFRKQMHNGLRIMLAAGCRALN